MTYILLTLTFISLYSLRYVVARENKFSRIFRISSKNEKLKCRWLCANKEKRRTRWKKFCLILKDEMWAKWFLLVWCVSRSCLSHIFSVCIISCLFHFLLSHDRKEKNALSEKWSIFFIIRYFFVAYPNYFSFIGRILYWFEKFVERKFFVMYTFQRI